MKKLFLLFLFPLVVIAQPGSGSGPYPIPGGGGSQTNDLTKVDVNNGVSTNQTLVNAKITDRITDTADANAFIAVTNYGNVGDGLMLSAGGEASIRLVVDGSIDMYANPDGIQIPSGRLIELLGGLVPDPNMIGIGNNVTYMLGSSNVFNFAGIPVFNSSEGYDFLGGDIRGGISTNTSSFHSLTNPITTGQFYTNLTTARATLYVNYTLNDSAVSGFPSLMMTNISSGQWFVATNDFALSTHVPGQVVFDMSPNDYFIATNKSSLNASTTINGSFLLIK